MQHNSLLGIQELQAKQQDLVEHQEGIRCWGIQVVPSLVNPTNNFFANRVIIDLNIYHFAQNSGP